MKPLAFDLVVEAMPRTCLTEADHQPPTAVPNQPGVAQKMRFWPSVIIGSGPLGWWLTCAAPVCDAVVPGRPAALAPPPHRHRHQQRLPLLPLPPLLPCHMHTKEGVGHEGQTEQPASEWCGSSVGAGRHVQWWLRTDRFSDEQVP